MTQLLVIEDEAGIADFVRRGLVAEGFEVQVARDGATGERLALDLDIELVVLDLMLPGRDGREVLRTVGAARPGLPVIVLTARGEVEDRIAGLRAGAVDYLVKPFAFGELLARIQTHLRIARRSPTTILRCGSLTLDLMTRRVRLDKVALHLSRTEFELLVYLVQHEGEILTRRQILRAVWGYEHDPQTNIVDVYVGYLRRKLTAPPSTPTVRIISVRSRGYRLEAEG